MVLDSTPPAPAGSHEPFERDACLDPAYPTTTPPDAMLPARTRAPLGPPLDEIATPAMWSRLAAPLERALDELWQGLGLLARHRPTIWVAIQYGRIALNAHGWERLDARFAGRTPDPRLVERSPGVVARVADRVEAMRARRRRGAVTDEITRRDGDRHAALRRASGRDPRELEPGEIARGPLDAHTWTTVLLPWLGRRLGVAGAPVGPTPDRALLTAIALEQRWAAEIGARLTARGTIDSPAHVAYLTVEERIRAVHEPSGGWAEIAAARLERIERFTKVDVPVEFMGRPRLEETWAGESAAESALHARRTG